MYSGQYLQEKLGEAGEAGLLVLGGLSCSFLAVGPAPAPGRRYHGNQKGGGSRARYHGDQSRAPSAWRPGGIGEWAGSRSHLKEAPPVREYYL